MQNLALTHTKQIESTLNRHAQEIEDLRGAHVLEIKS